MISMNPLNRVLVILATLMAVVAVLALAPARARAAGAADGGKGWRGLGDAKIERKGGTAEIKVGAEEGLVKRIKFEVRGTDVEFKKVVVTYEKGDPEEV